MYKYKSRWSEVASSFSSALEGYIGWVISEGKNSQDIGYLDSSLKTQKNCKTRFAKLPLSFSIARFLNQDKNLF